MKEYQDTLRVALKGTILDIRATTDYPFSLGYIAGDTLRIVQLQDDSPPERERMSEELHRASELERPFYICDMKTQRWIERPVDYDLEQLWQRVGEEFRPPYTRWCEQCGWVYKWTMTGKCQQCGFPVRDMARELQPRPAAWYPRGLGPPGDEGGAVWWWRQYLKERDPGHLFVIALKSQADLLAGCCLVLWLGMGLPLGLVL